MQVSQIMATPVKTIDKDQPVSAAIELMEKFKISALPVTEGDKLVGLITQLELVDRLGSVRAGQLSPSSIHVSSVMLWNPKTVTPTTNIMEAAKILTQHQEGAIPVCEKGEVRGILTNTHFVKQCKTINNLTVRELRIEKPISVRLTDRVVHARQILLSHKFPGIPIFDEGKVIGLVSKSRMALGFAAFRREIPAKYQSTRLREFLVSNIYTKTEAVTSFDMLVGEAAELLLQESQHLLPVMDKGKMEGILIRRNMVDLVAHNFQPRNSSSCDD
jgi:acetoin utilization protein AcuB